MASETSSTAVIVPRRVLNSWLTWSRASRGSGMSRDLPLQADLRPVVAGADVTVYVGVVERRIVVPAALARVRAARVEGAARRQVDQARRRAGDGRDLVQIADHRRYRLQ